MIARDDLLQTIRRALKRAVVVALVGPRQSGKTTLARQLLPSNRLEYFDLEDPTSLARLAEPMTALADLRGIVVIDEIQRRPDLFPVLRVLADRRPVPARFLILGSASPRLLQQSAESLAGRIEVLPISGFSLHELGPGALPRHWIRGGYPRSYLARSSDDSFAWRQQFVSTFLERDVPQLGSRIIAPTLQRFWSMVAHYHAQTWNAAEPARSLGLSEPTVRHYLDLLSGLFMIRQLPPWHENLKKRQVRSPKVYVRDSGLLHMLLGVRSERELQGHPKLGASWEGYAVEQVLAAAGEHDAYFWSTYQGAELDLLLIRGDRRAGVEFKRSDAPTLTPSMQIAMEDLRLERLTVFYPGDRAYPLGGGVHVAPLSSLSGNGMDLLLPRLSNRKGARRTPGPLAN